MCGIAGRLAPRRLDPATIDACLGRMRRRGPDASGHLCLETVPGTYLHLLHTRLNIIDLDPRANQPFALGTKWMAFNGELYNYLELRRELEADGHTFRTSSDTEVLLRLLDARGWAALDACEGMWALAVYDEADRTLTLARDRFGEKPLYTWTDGRDVYFGSEVKFIATLAGRRLDPDLGQVLRYLVNGYKSLYKNGDTFFSGVREVPPATVLQIRPDGTREEHRYWELSFRPCERLSYEDAVAGVRERLTRSVKLRLRADVPLAFCMSGGVDSNALISVAKKTLGYDVHGFTVMNTDERYDEQALVEASVQALGVRHTTIRIEPDGAMARLRELVRQHDAPVATISYFVHWRLMEAIAAHGYKIAISGTAADELLTGYYDHHLAYLAEVHGEPAIHGPARDAWLEYVAPLVRNPYLKDPDRFTNDRSFRGHVFLDADRFAEYLTRPWSEPFHERRYTGDLLRNRMMNELFHEVVPVILHEDDLNAMYYSIENRSPFLDRELAEYCFSIPTRHLIRNGYAKSLLRDAVRGVAPDPVVNNRRKVGFNAPARAFVNTHDPEVRSQLLDESPIFDLVRRDRIERLLDTEDLPNSQSKFLFYFVTTKMFLEESAA